MGFEMQENTASKGAFRARSGRTVRVGADGTVMFDHANGYLSPLSAMDAEEFFQAKRDEELGRWRYPLDPRLVAYSEDERVRIMFEPGGGSQVWTRKIAMDAPGSPQRDAALAYFEAHPERKPWEDAKPGEVWVINIGDDTDAANWQGVVVSNEGRFLYRDGGSVAIDQDFIIDGRRIWPEDAS